MSLFSMDAAPRPAPSLDVREIYEAYVETFVTQDPARIVERHAPDGSFWLHAGGAPAVGREAIAQTFAGFFAQWPQFGFEIRRVIFAERHWILDWVVTAVLPTADGVRPIRFDALDVIDLDHQGLVARKDTWVDAAQLRAQLAA